MSKYINGDVYGLLYYIIRYNKRLYIIRAFSWDDRTYILKPLARDAQSIVVAADDLNGCEIVGDIYGENEKK